MKPVVSHPYLTVMFLTISGVDLAHAQVTQSPRTIELKIVDSIKKPELLGANRLVMTADGRRLFCAAWRGNAIVKFDFDSDGSMVYAETLRNPVLQGAIKLCLNDEENLMACICLRSNRVVLLKHSPETGELSVIGSSEADLTWPVAIAFSPDSQYLYVADAGGPGRSVNAKSELVTFKIVDRESVVEVSRNAPDRCLGMRNVITSHDGEHCYACCAASGSILVFSRDQASGEPTLIQSVNAETSEATLLDGIHTAAFNSDESRLYCISGRFMGQSAVTVFHRLRDGRLTLARELSLESDRFSGGNDIVVSQDESLIIASATNSSSLAVITQELQSGTFTLHSLVTDDSDSRLMGASGLLLNPTEKKLYVAAENGSAVSTLEFVDSL